MDDTGVAAATGDGRRRRLQRVVYEDTGRARDGTHTRDGGGGDGGGVISRVLCGVDDRRA